jgi:hypothetical protein
MSNLIVETKSGNFLLVGGATSPQEAIKIALLRAVEFGIPVAARLTSPDPLEPEPAIAMYLSPTR